MRRVLAAFEGVELVGAAAAGLAAACAAVGARAAVTPSLKARVDRDGVLLENVGGGTALVSNVWFTSHDNGVVAGGLQDALGAAAAAGLRVVADDAVDTWTKERKLCRGAALRLATVEGADPARAGQLAAAVRAGRVTLGVQYRSVVTLGWVTMHHDKEVEVCLT
jgi:hypothetical protein